MATIKKRTRGLPFGRAPLPPLRKLRMARGIEAADLAAKVGIHPTSLWRIETGRAWPSIDTGHALAAALGLTPEELLNLLDTEAA